MYNDGRVYLESKMAQFLMDQNSPGGKAFMEGARAMLKALRNLTHEEFTKATANAGNSHITAVLIEAERRNTELHRNDVRAHLDAYEWDICEALEFLFNLSGIISFGSGRAISRDGNYLEDENFRPLAEEETTGWADCTFEYHGDGDKQITRERYLMLDAPERNEYAKSMFFALRLNGNVVMKGASYDACFVGELIKKVIAGIGSISILQRFYLYATDDSYQHEYGDSRWCPLDNHRDLVLKCLHEKYGTSTASFLVQSLRGPETKGRTLIAAVESMVHCAKDVTPELTEELKGMLEACLDFDDKRLATYITNSDLAMYRDVNGDSLVGHKPDVAPTVDNCKSYLKCMAVPKLCEKMALRINTIVTTTDGVVSAEMKSRLRHWTNLLMKYDYITSNDPGAMFGNS